MSSNKYGDGDILERERLESSVGGRVQYMQNRSVVDLSWNKRVRIKLPEAPLLLPIYARPRHPENNEEKCDFLKIFFLFF